MAKPKLTAVTPHGTYTRITWRPYRFIAVWMMPDNGEKVASWHLELDNVEMNGFSGKFQLLGVYKLQPTGQQDTPVEWADYLV